MGLFNRLVGSPKWAYEGLKGEVVSVTSGIAGAVGGLGDYVVDSVSDITYGTGGALEYVGESVGRGLGGAIGGTLTGVTKPVGQLGKDLTLPLLIAAGFFLLKK
jgi:hypothetical protein